MHALPTIDVIAVGRRVVNFRERLNETGERPLTGEQLLVCSGL